MSDRSPSGPLEEWSDEELRAEAARRGLPVGSSLGRERLLALLEGEGPEAPDDEQPSGGAPDGSAPLSTVTMARLYAEQGHAAEAARICRAVLARRPDERRARALLARLAGARVEPARGQGRTPREAPGAEPTPRPHGPPPEAVFGPGGDAIVLVALSPSRLHAFWHASEGAVGRARRHAGGGGDLVLRLFSAWSGPDGVVRRTVDEPASGEGSRFLAGCAPAAVHRAALGWAAAEGRFVPVVHSAAVETPPGRAVGAGSAAAVEVPVATGARRSPEAAGRLLARLADALPMDLPWEDGATRWPEPDRSSSAPALAPEPEASGGRAPSSWS